jgi:hypothetical protein
MLKASFREFSFYILKKENNPKSQDSNLTDITDKIKF